MKPILLLSGGVDSYIAWCLLNQPPTLHITGHSRYSEQEYNAVMKLVPQSHIIAMPFLRRFEEEDATIPARNLLFATAASFFGDKIYLVCQRGERTKPDRSPSFFRAASRLLTSLRGHPVALDPVFPLLTKADMIGLYVSLGYPLENLKKTYSCFTGGSERCGRCSCCFRLAVALEHNNIPSDDWFEKNPFEWDGVQDYIKKLQAGEYESRRTIQTMRVLKRKGLV